METHENYDALSILSKNTNLELPSLKSDAFFTAAQQKKLNELMTQWRTARDADADFAAELQAELDALIETELRGTAFRAEAILRNTAR